MSDNVRPRIPGTRRRPQQQAAFSKDPRLTRIGFDFDWDPRGHRIRQAHQQLETDFDTVNNGPSSNPAVPRIRLAYSAWLAGGPDRHPGTAVDLIFLLPASL